MPVDATPWPADRYERASVNSFGIGGANCRLYSLESKQEKAAKKLEQTSSWTLPHPLTLAILKRQLHPPRV